MPAHFQRMVEKALSGCREFSSPYIDDVLIFSKEPGEHIAHIKRVLTALRKAGLTAKPAKCEWGRQYLTYLGHWVGRGKVAVPEARAEAIKNYKCPKTQKQLCAFLGALGYYGRFISDFAKLSRVLTPSTSPNAPKTVQWTSQMEEAFVSLKSMLCKYVILTVPNITDHFQVQTDASHQGLGAALNVIREGKEYPVCFFSRQLRGTEKNYSAMEIEALGVVEAVEHWAHFLYGQRFEVLTDHRALCYLTTSQHLNKRLRGFALRLTMYDCSI